MNEKNSLIMNYTCPECKQDFKETVTYSKDGNLSGRLFLPFCCECRDKMLKKFSLGKNQNEK